MEKRNKSLENFKRNTLALAGGTLLTILAINGSMPKEIKTFTSTYQGYMTDPLGKKYLVFDDLKKYQRVSGTEYPAIQGNPDTLEIGKKYTIEYSIPKWENIFPKRIKSIK